MQRISDKSADDFAKNLQKILLENAGIHDTAKYPEAFYNGLFLGFSLLMVEDYEVKSNGESGYGRFDMAFIPLDNTKPGVVLEFKRAASENELDKKIAEGLAQIKEKEYLTVLRQKGVTEIWQYGVAFCGKQVKLANG